MSEKWWDMSDDELDDLFRDASDKVDIPFDSSSFDKLRHKMDSQRQPEVPKGFKKRWLLLLAGLILLVGVGLVYRFSDKKRDLKENNLRETVGNIDNKNALVLSESNKKGEINNKSALLKPEISSVQNDKAIEELNSLLPVDKRINNIATVGKAELSPMNTTEKHSQTTKTQIIKQEKVSGKSKSLMSLQIIKKENSERSFVETTGSSNQIRAGKNDNQVINKSQIKTSENIYQNSSIIDNQLVTNGTVKNRSDRKDKNQSSNPIVIEQIMLPIIDNLPVIQEKTVSEENMDRINFYDVNSLKNKDLKLLLTAIHTELPDFVDSLPRLIKPIKFLKFGLRLVLSPDFNSLENLGTSTLGGTVGLLFEYKFSNRLILQTGITYSNKKYVGSFDDYHNWTDWRVYHPSKPTEVDGGCKIIDIPLNLRVNLFQKPKQTWFVSSGISSYLLTKESYTYIYNWTPSKTTDWNDNSKYYWSVLNFSVGFDKQISKHFSLQIEPYLKTPLKSVGRGGVNLYSSGVLFSTKYEF